MLSVCPTSHTMQVTMPKNNVTRFGSSAAHGIDYVQFSGPFTTLNNVRKNDPKLFWLGALATVSGIGPIIAEAFKRLVELAS